MGVLEVETTPVENGDVTTTNNTLTNISPQPMNDRGVNHRRVPF